MAENVSQSLSFRMPDIAVPQTQTSSSDTSTSSPNEFPSLYYDQDALDFLVSVPEKQLPANEPTPGPSVTVPEFMFPFLNTNATSAADTTLAPGIDPQQQQVDMSWLVSVNDVFCRELCRQLGRQTTFDSLLIWHHPLGYFEVFRGFERSRRLAGAVQSTLRCTLDHFCQRRGRQPSLSGLRSVFFGLSL